VVIPTKKVDFISPAVCDNLRAKMEQVCVALKDVYGMEFSIGPMSYARDGTTGSMKIDFGIISDGGIVQTKERRYFRARAEWLGLSKSDLDKVILTENGPKKIVGIIPRVRRYPVLLEHPQTGQQTKATVQYVKNYLSQGVINDGRD